MKKTVSILMVLMLVLAMLAGCGSSDNGPAGTELGQSENVVILVLDALSSQYLSQMGASSNLAKIAKAGSAVLDARCVFPAHTPTNHATIMTGVSAGVHGIIGNVGISEDGICAITEMGSEAIKAQTLFEMAKAQGLKTAAVSGKDDLVTIFSKDCDVITSNVRSLPYLDSAPNPEDAKTDKDYHEMSMELADWVFASLYTVLEKESPNLTLVNVQSADDIGHRFGPDSDEMKTCLKRIDKALGKLYEKMEKSGMLDNTTLIIVADHGMTEVSSTVDLDALTMTNFFNATAANDGGTGYIWLNGTSEMDVVSFFADVKGVAAVFSSHSNIASRLGVNSEDGPDLILEAEPGYAFLPQSMTDAFHGQHGTSSGSDMTIPMVMVGGGIPAGAGVEITDLRAVAPLVCKLLGIPAGSFEISEPTFLPQQDLSAFKK